MELDARGVSAALRRQGVRLLYHANTVRTSCTLLSEGRLLSRGAVEDAGLAQTRQESDALDRRYGIWHDVFLDSVDIHYRARRRNLYGPVLFAFPVSILDGPEITSVWITRRNPIRWRPEETDEDRFYASVPEFAEEFQYGDFHKHMMIRNADSISLETVEAIVVDEPSYEPNTLVTAAEAALVEAAADGGAVNPRVMSRRTCRHGCRCAPEYDGLTPDQRRLLFAP